MAFQDSEKVYFEQFAGDAPEVPEPPFYGMTGWPWDNHRILFASNGCWETHHWNSDNGEWVKIDCPPTP